MKWNQARLRHGRVACPENGHHVGCYPAGVFKPPLLRTLRCSTPGLVCHDTPVSAMTRRRGSYFLPSGASSSDTVALETWVYCQL